MMIDSINLKEYRLMNNLTQQDVADFLGIAQSQYNKHENGKSLLNARQIIILCELFKCSPNELLGFRGVHTVVASIIDDKVNE